MSETETQLGPQFDPEEWNDIGYLMRSCLVDAEDNPEEVVPVQIDRTDSEGNKWQVMLGNRESNEELAFVALKSVGDGVRVFSVYPESREVEVVHDTSESLEDETTDVTKQSFDVQRDFGLLVPNDEEMDEFRKLLVPARTEREMFDSLTDPAQEA